MDTEQNGIKTYKNFTQDKQKSSQETTCVLETAGNREGCASGELENSEQGEKH